MTYRVEFKPRAVRDLEELSIDVRRRIVAKIDALQDNLSGDVKRLHNVTPEYRLRVGDYRVLFEVEGDVAMIYRVTHRRDAYRS